MVLYSRDDAERGGSGVGGGEAGTWCGGGAYAGERVPGGGVETICNSWEGGRGLGGQDGGAREGGGGGVGKEGEVRALYGGLWSGWGGPDLSR